MRPAVPPTHRQDIMIAARREPLPPPPPPPCPTSFSSFPHAWGTYTYGHQHNQMAVQLIPRRTSRFPTPLKGRAQVACPRQTSRTHCKRCVYFFKKKKKGNGKGDIFTVSAFYQATSGKEGAGQLTTYEALAHGSVGLIMYVCSLYTTSVSLPFLPPPWCY
jgi:hypothetical protein